MLWMVLGTLCFAGMMLIIRYLVEELPIPLIVALRNELALLVFLPFVIGRALPKTEHARMYGFRVVAGLGSMLLWSTALEHMYVSDVTALSYTAPLFAVILSAIFLKDSLNKHHIIALAAGLAGTLMIVDPSTESIVNEWSLAVLAAALLWAGVDVFIKRLSSVDDTITVLFYTWAGLAMLSTPLAVLYWQEVTLNQWLWLLLLGGVSNAAMYCLIKAFSKAELSFLMPLDYLRLVFVAIAAWFAFGEVVSTQTMLGALLIILAGTFNIRIAKAHKKHGNKDSGPLTIS